MYTINIEFWNEQVCDPKRLYIMTVIGKHWVY